MAKKALNQKSVDALKFEGKREIIWDENLRGFGVSIASRSKSYVVQYVADGKEKRVTLGDAGAYKFADAFARASEILAGARNGKDLLAKSEGERMTFRACAEAWIENGGRDGKPRSPATVKDYRDRFARLLFPTLGDKVLTSISRADVNKLLADLGSQERNRSYCVTLIKAVFNYAVAARHLPKTHENPADEIRVSKTKTEKRVLMPEELQRFGVALAEMEKKGQVSPWLAGLLRLSLLLGLRPGEAQSLQWKNLDVERRVATVVGKTGARSVPLTDAALEALAKVPQVQGVPWVFCGRKHGEHIVAVAKQLDRIADQAGVKRFAPYAFRHSAATNALAAGADVRAVQALLGHTDLQTTAGYLHSTAERQRAAAEHVANVVKGHV